MLLTENNINYRVFFVLLNICDTNIARIICIGWIGGWVGGKERGSEGQRGIVRGSDVSEE